MTGVLPATELETFRGEVITDDAWRVRNFRGLRVAVIAPADEAALIVPPVVRTALAVKVFQQEPAWILPALPREVPRVVRVAAALATRERHVHSSLGRLYLRARVKDPWLRRQLTPDAHFGTRPAAASSRYYRALREPNCTLVTWPVYAIVEHGVRTAEGIEHRADCIVLGGSQAADRRPADG